MKNLTENMSNLCLKLVEKELKTLSAYPNFFQLNLKQRKERSELMKLKKLLIERIEK